VAPPYLVLPGYDLFQRRYVRFNEILGKGAYKMVYRAYDTKEGLLVAWNTISLSGLPKHEKVRRTFGPRMVHLRFLILHT
jgi:hypothetical protein